MTVTIYHNPACGTSRNTLEMIRQSGEEPEVVEYLKAPPSRERLIELIHAMGIRPRDLLREKGTPYAELGLGNQTLSDDALLDAMMAHPILINRPIVVTDKGAALCRPSEKVLPLLANPVATFTKEDGETCRRHPGMIPTLVATAVDDPAGLVGLLSAAGLPTEDVAEPGRVFLRYATEDGEFVGIGGFEPLGAAVLLRSIVVVPEQRGRGVGGAIAADLMQRGRGQGAADAFAFTTGERTFLAALGFRRVERTEAPAAVLATRQAMGLCSASAVLWRKETAR